MTIRQIIYLNQPQLRAPNLEVKQFDSALHQLIEDMFETMYFAKGIGLAAPQIGINQQIAVIDVTPDRSKTWCLINPEIIWREGEELLEEGCLSIPGASGRVKRALRLELKAQDLKGQFYQVKADGLLAHCIQHELDHLQGQLFIDHLSLLKQQRAKKQFQKTMRRLKQ